MSQGARTRLHLISRQPAVADKVEKAKAKYGKPWGFEKGSNFKWTSGPSVLSRWLANLKREQA